MRHVSLPFAVVASMSAVCAHGAVIEGDAFATRFALLGQVAPRAAAAIAANDWSVGAEAMDRDYSSYAAWRTYLGPLGAKHVRLQSGWARTDAGGGKLDFEWLDPIVDDVGAQGVAPWLSLSYGNPAYPGGGTARRDSPLPEGAGRAAWLRYVEATARRYMGRVATFEIWNEPDLNARITAAGYGRFAVETARAIRRGQPRAAIVVGTFAHAVWGKLGAPEDPARRFAREALEVFAREGGQGLADTVSYHVYHPNPDAVQASLPGFRAMVRAIAPGWRLRQGESGAPSLNQQHYALRNLWWTEEAQAKYLLRRMLGDAAAGVPTSVFSLTEMHFPVAAETNLTWVGRTGGDKPAADTAKHFKGLLETRRYAPGTPDDDRSVVRTKMGYAAMQAVTAIFDARLRPVEGGCTATGGDGPLAVHAFRRDDGAALLAVWRNGDKPGDRPMHAAVTLRCNALRLATGPRYVDLLTRAVYRTAGVAAAEGEALVVRDLPVYDSPVLIADAVLVDAR